MSRCQETAAPCGTTAIAKSDNKMMIEPQPIAKSYACQTSRQSTSMLQRSIPASRAALARSIPSSALAIAINRALTRPSLSRRASGAVRPN
jgi:hypothetical protein